MGRQMERRESQAGSRLSTERHARLNFTNLRSWLEFNQPRVQHLANQATQAPLKSFLFHFPDPRAIPFATAQESVKIYLALDSPLLLFLQPVLLDIIPHVVPNESYLSL